MMVKLQTDNYVEQAEKVMQDLQAAGKGQIKLTTSKIRSILAMVSELYNDAQRLRAETLSEDLVGRVQYLKMRIAYEAGREGYVREFVKKAAILEEIDRIGRKKEQLLLFCHYMEALVAYHKFLGGRDY
jgi:CRISPR-associated protein Csm2